MATGQSIKRRRLSPPTDGIHSPTLNDFRNRAAGWDLEQDYERRPRKTSKKIREQTRLPIKTSEGIVQKVDELELASEEESDSFLGTDDGGADSDADSAKEATEQIPDVPLKTQIIQAKEELARLAALINEDPEEHISSFKGMAEMVGKGSHVAVRKLALASQAVVYKDVIPGYRIRPLSEGEMSAKVSKDVRKLRAFEQSLVSSYKSYIQTLVSLTKSQKDGSEVDSSLKSVAINCACSLLLAVPHFNFRQELLKIIVNRLARKKVDDDFVKCRDTLEEIFSKDEDGVVSLEAVRLLSKMMRAREYQINGSILDTFLRLRLLSEFTGKGSMSRIEREPEEDTHYGKNQRQKREFRTKRERKIEKERKVVEKDMKEADALVSHEARDKNQAETLKLVFAAYFRILKLRSPSLMGPVLEGLAKYAHLINQDFFGDLLEALKDLITHADQTEEDEENLGEGTEGQGLDSGRKDHHREALLCTVTAFTLLEGQDANKAAASLHLDLSFFTKHLYRSLYTLSTNADVEYNPHKSIRLADPGRKSSEVDTPRPRNKVNFQTPTVLLLRCLQSVLLSRAHGTPPLARVGGFTKRLLTSVLQLPEKSAIATFALLKQVVKYNARRIAPLWHTEERKGDGVFDPYAPDVERTNVFAGTIWEGELLRAHYCPQVRDAVMDIEKVIAKV